MPRATKSHRRHHVHRSHEKQHKETQHASNWVTKPTALYSHVRPITKGSFGYLPPHLQHVRSVVTLLAQLSPQEIANSKKFLLLNKTQRKNVASLIFQSSASLSTSTATTDSTTTATTTTKTAPEPTNTTQELYHTSNTGQYAMEGQPININADSTYTEGIRPKIKDARILTDADAILKVFGNRNEEDPSEPIIRSILPGGIARATGIENPRLGAFITIHLTKGDNRADPFSIDQRSSAQSNALKPTIQPAGNTVQAEIIRITRHEVFLALPCAPELVSIEDRVSKTKNIVPGFRVPTTTKKKALIKSAIQDEDLLDDLGVVKEMDDDDLVTPLLGSVLNAFGEPIEKLVKNIELGDENAEIIVNHDLLKKHTKWVPYSNTVARNVFSGKNRSKLKLLTGIVHGQPDIDEVVKHQAEFQQLYQSFDDEPTYTNQIDDESDNEDMSSRRGPRMNTLRDEDEIKNDPFLAPPLKKAQLNSLLQKDKQFIERLELPDAYKGSNTAQLLTGLPQIDMFNPIRKGSRNLFSSSNSAELSGFGQIVFKNILLQSVDHGKAQVDHAKMSSSDEPQRALNLNNANITPTIDSTLLGLKVPGDTPNEQLPDDVIPPSTKLTPRDLLESTTIGIYCAVGKTVTQKSQLLKNLSPVLPQSIIIHTNEHDTPYTHTQAVKQATALSDQLRLQGKNVIVVYDDLYHHAQSVMKLAEPFNMAMGSGIAGNYHAVNSAHAALLDNIGTIQQTPPFHHLSQKKATGDFVNRSPIDINAVKNTDRATIGASTAICLYTSMPETAIPSVQLRQSHQIHDGLKSIVDRSIPFHPHLQGGGFWPPIEVQPLYSALPSVSPFLRKVMQNMNSRVIESQNLFEYAQISQGLGITLDVDVEQTIEWKAKVQAMLMQSPAKQYSLTEQYVLTFSAIQDKILAGIEVPDIPTYKRFLLKNVQQYPTLMNVLQNIVNVSTELPLKGYKRQFVHPDALYSQDHLLSRENEAKSELQLNEDGTIVDGQSDRLLDDFKTKQLLLRHQLQPFMTPGTQVSPIDDFLSTYFYDQIDPQALADVTRPLFKQHKSQFTDGYEFPQDTVNYHPILQRIQKKFFVGSEYQTDEHRAQFESLFKSNTVGKYGLPGLLDELLQVIVDDIYEEFCIGAWKKDPNYQHFGSMGTGKYIPDQAEGGDAVHRDALYSNPGFSRDSKQIATDDNFVIDATHFEQSNVNHLFEGTYHENPFPTENGSKQQQSHIQPTPNNDSNSSNAAPTKKGWLW